MRMLMAALIALPLAAAAHIADAATRNIPVPGFVKLRIEGPYTVRVHTGARPSVKASGPAARLDRLLVESRGDTLVISTEKGWSWRSLRWGNEDNVFVDVTVPALEAAELTGSGDVTIDRVRSSNFTALLTGSGGLSIDRLDASRLAATVTGSGDLSLAGRTGRADAAVTGSGNIRGTRLVVDLLTASVKGSGDIAIGPTRVAKAKVTGSGNISIAGRPSCTKTKTGSGEIHCGG